MGTSFFSYLSQSEREYVVSLLQERSLETGEILFSPEESAQGVFFLQEGRIGVQTNTGFEDKTQIVALLEPGAVVGEIGFVQESKRGMTAVALEKTVLMYFSANHFATVEDENPALALKILKKLMHITSLRLRESSQRLAHVL